MILITIFSCILPYNTGKAYSVVAGQKVYDDGNLFTPDQISKLTEHIQKVEKKCENEIYILTTYENDGYYSDEYIDVFFDEGHNKKNLFGEDTIILLFNMSYTPGQSEIYMSSYGRMENKFPNYNDIYAVTDSMASYCKDHDFYGACIDGLDKIETKVTTNYFIFHTWFQVVTAIVIASIIVGIMAISRSTPMTTNAYSYMDEKNSKLRFKHDNYIRTTVTKKKKPQNNSSGGGSAHHSGGSSGHSHSGGGSRF